MNKTTIELERNTNHIKGYGMVKDKTWTESEMLDKIIEWSNKDDGPNLYGGVRPKKQVYKHILRIEEENIRENDLYIPFQNDAIRHNQIPIPRCDRVKYLDIYWQ